MSDSEACAEANCRVAQTAEEGCLAPSEAATAAIDVCPVQDIELGVPGAPAPGAGRPSAADGSNQAPPTGMVSDSARDESVAPRIVERSRGNGPAAATRRVAGALHAGAPPLSGQVEPPPPATFDANIFIQRAIDFFFRVAGGPVATGDGGASARCTLSLIQVVNKARNYLWKHRRADIVALFAPAPIAKQEVFAYLLVDALGLPLLHKDYALSVGQRGDNGLAKAESDAKACKQSTYNAVRAARRAAESNPGLVSGIADEEKAGATALATALDKTYDIKPPAVTVGAKRKEPESLTPEQTWEAAKAKSDVLNRAAEATQQKADELCALHGEARPPRRNLSNSRERSLAESEALCHAKVQAALQAASDAWDAVCAQDKLTQALWWECVRLTDPPDVQVLDAPCVSIPEPPMPDDEDEPGPRPSFPPLPTASEWIFRTNTCGPSCLLYPDICPPTRIWVEWDGQEFNSSYMEWELAREEDGKGWREARLEREFEASYRREDRFLDDLRTACFHLDRLDNMECTCGDCRD